MSIQWYPVIDYKKCTRCGICIHQCPHGVYDKESVDPLVLQPENCIEGCHGCQKRCSSGAIQYVGDFGLDQSCQCENKKAVCDCQPETTTINIDFLYLDLTACTRCQGTESVLEKTIAEASLLLKASGYTVSLRKIHIDSLEKAKTVQFSLSPTIRVNGEDIALVSQESLCKECGDLCDDQVTCRSWSYQGKSYDEPPKEILMEAILQIVKQPSSAKKATKPYEVPSNIIHFFASLAKKNKRK
jgi:NAD-dependent dihydropyrimidine dehydrogenase PreA subunit